MIRFRQLDNLPVYDLYTELNKLLDNNIINWPSSHAQICLNTVTENSDDYSMGTGSLIYDWNQSYDEIDEFGNKKTVLVKFENPYVESDFKFLCNQFKGTLFENVYYALEKVYNIGRVRIMKSKSKTCLTWHKDDTPRVHYPIKTQRGCFMVIEDEILHLEQNKWYWTDTLVKHTAFNSSLEDRIHLVVTILGEK
jgi:hypothetical protein